MPKKAQNNRMICGKPAKHLVWGDQNVYYLSIAGKCPNQRGCQGKECSLAKKLNVTPAMARDIEAMYKQKQDMTIVIRGGDGKFDGTSLLYDNAKALLKQHFGIQRVSNKALIQGFERKVGPNNYTTVAGEFNSNVPTSGDQVSVITGYFSFASGLNFDILYVIEIPWHKEYERLKRLRYNNKITREQLNNFVLEHIIWDNVQECVDYSVDSKTLTHTTLDKNMIAIGIRAGPLYERDSEFETKSGPISDSAKKAEAILEEYIKDMKDVGGVYEFSIINVIGEYSGRKMELREGILREEEENIYKFEEWANLEYWNIADEDSCAVKFLCSKYPKCYWELKKLETMHGIKFGDFQLFCDEYEIPYVFRDCKGKLIAENLFENKFDRKVTLTGVYYCDHIYPYVGGYILKKTPNSKISNVLIESGREKMIELLDKKEIPRCIKVWGSTDKLEIISMVHKKNRYIQNPDYEKCKKYLTAMGYEMYLKDTTRVTDIPKILEKIFNIEKKSSFFPHKSEYKTCALNYRKNRYKDYIGDDIHTWDKNKSFLSALKSLEKCLYFDLRTDEFLTHKPKKFEVESIEKHHLYWCTPNFFSAHIPETAFYEGKDLIEFLKLGIPFSVRAELCTTSGPNYWQKIIDLMHKHMHNDDFKAAGNIIIGCFERRYKIKTKCVFDSILKGNDIKMRSGFKTELGDHTLCFNTKKEIVGVRDNFPIAVQLKNAARMEIVRFIERNNIPHKNILAICTDSITWYGKDTVTDKSDPKDISGWKKIKVDIQKLADFGEPMDERKHIKFKEIPGSNLSTRVLYDQYAGGGKTYYITNVLIPRLVKRGLSYLVLTPSHKTLQEYKKLGLVCEIIQYFHYVDKNIPIYDYYIIDEIGMMDLKCHDILYKIYMTGKPYACFGDFKQLLPFDKKECNQEKYLQFMFNKINKDWTNYRNNFTKEYYDSLLQRPVYRSKYKHSEFLIREVKRNSVSIDGAELIICYTHETRNKYNDIMLKKLGLEPFGEGTKVISMTNKMIDHGIYNRKELIVHKCFLDHKILIDDFGKKYNVPNSRFRQDIKKPYFSLGYCINIHQVQGMTVKSYHWCEEDDIFINERIAYTIISRLFEKNDLNSKPSEPKDDDYEEIYRYEEDGTYKYD